MKIRARLISFPQICCHAIALTIAMAVGAATVVGTAAFASEPGDKMEVKDVAPSTYNQDVSSTANIHSATREEIAQISKKIDALVSETLEANGQKWNREIDDETFVRRVHLDIAGRIPTLQESRDFLSSRSKTKREDLIDSLLNSYGFVSNQFNFWADILRARTRMNKVAGQPYIDFIKDSLEANQPYDEFVRELLVSEGRMMEKDAGATGYYLRDIDMPEDNMSNTVRVFLGTRLECAQCHDHPFDKWTQRDYFEMVAFTGGIKYRNGDLLKELSKDDRKKLEALKKESPEQFFKIRRLVGYASIGVYGSGTGLARLPEGFMGDDGEENEVIVGATMFGDEPLVDAKPPVERKNKRQRKRKSKRPQQIPGAKEVNSRSAYAQWLTSESNSRFATTIANRYWKQAFGLALIEPVDVIDDSTTASNPALMEYLSQLMVDLNFDRKQFLRAIYYSRTYQSQATREDVIDPAKYYFNGPIVRRMSAEQIWDSLMVLTVPKPDRRYEVSSNYRQAAMDTMVEELTDRGEVDIDKWIAFAGGERNGDAMMNEMKQKSRDLKARLRALNKQIARANRSGNPGLAKKLMLQRASEVAEMKSSSINGRFRRASELTSPAPAGHFLREFGQSDRDQIENSNRDPAVTQVLSMMNGFVDQTISRDPNSVLMMNVLKADRKDVIDVIYGSMLSRSPTRNEVRDWTSSFKSNPKDAYIDLIWTLANSNEFIFLK